MRFSHTTTRGKTKHTISLLTDTDLSTIYHAMPDGNAIKEGIKQHLVDCVTEEDLADSGANTEEEYVSNWLIPKHS